MMQRQIVKRKVRRGPTFTIREGSARVIAYRLRDGRFCLTYRKHAGAPRSRETRKNESDARIRAREIAVDLANGRAEVTELTHADRESYLRAQSLLAGAGVPLHEAVEAFLYARSRRGPTTTVVDIAAKFLLAKETAQGIGDLSQVHVKNLRDDINKFSTAFPGKIGSIHTDQIQDWLNRRCDRKGNKVGPRRRRNLRSRVVALFNYARDCGYLPMNERHAAEKTARPKIIKGVEPTFEPEQFAVLINAAHRDKKYFRLVPALALGAFGRMRMSEIARLQWQAIHLDAGEIDVSARVAGKTGMARIIDIDDNLDAWLRPYMRDSGPVLDPSLGRIDNYLRRFAGKVGLKWQRNILRGSCASYLYALTNDLKYVAAQLGTSERELKREYLERKTKAQAEYWHTITPTDPENVIRLSPQPSRESCRRG